MLRVRNRTTRGARDSLALGKSRRRTNGSRIWSWVAPSHILTPESDGRTTYLDSNRDYERVWSVADPRNHGRCEAKPQSALSSSNYKPNVRDSLPNLSSPSCSCSPNREKLGTNHHKSPVRWQPRPRVLFLATYVCKHPPLRRYLSCPTAFVPVSGSRSAG